MFGRIGLAALLVVPGAAQGIPPAGRPDWIQTLPEVPGKLYALGTADLGAHEGEAIRQASDRARLEVVARLRATVHGLTRITTRTSETKAAGGNLQAAGDRQVRDEVLIEARAEDLPGLVVERTYPDSRARTAYALACLDLGQARGTLAARLERIHQRRTRLGGEWTRKARWRLRRIKDDLDRLDASVGLLASAGAGQDLRPALMEEQAAVDQRLDDFEGRSLPPLDLASTATNLQANVELPDGVAAYLESRISECGLLFRNLNPDLTVSLTFKGDSRGPAFIYAEMDVYAGLNYRMEAQLAILDDEGTPLTRPVTLQVIQAETPEGMVDQFRRQFERRLPRLVAEVQAQFR